MIFLCRMEEWPEGRCLLVPGTPHPPLCTACGPFFLHGCAFLGPGVACMPEPR